MFTLARSHTGRVNGKSKMCDMFRRRDVEAEISYDDTPIEERRRSIEDLYALIGRPVPEYWLEKLWNR